MKITKNNINTATLPELVAEHRRAAYEATTLDNRAKGTKEGTTAHRSANAKARHAHYRARMLWNAIKDATPTTPVDLASKIEWYALEFSSFVAKCVDPDDRFFGMSSFAWRWETNPNVRSFPGLGELLKGLITAADSIAKAQRVKASADITALFASVVRGRKSIERLWERNKGRGHLIGRLELAYVSLGADCDNLEDAPLTNIADLAVKLRHLHSMIDAGKLLTEERAQVFVAAVKAVATQALALVEKPAATSALPVKALPRLRARRAVPRAPVAYVIAKTDAGKAVGA